VCRLSGCKLSLCYQANACCCRDWSAVMLDWNHCSLDCNQWRCALLLTQSMTYIYQRVITVIAIVVVRVAATCRLPVLWTESCRPDTINAANGPSSASIHQFIVNDVADHLLVAVHQMSATVNPLPPSPCWLRLLRPVVMVTTATLNRLINQRHQLKEAHERHYIEQYDFSIHGVNGRIHSGQHFVLRESGQLA